MIKVKMGIISVQDYDRAKEFYTKKLGFTVTTDAAFGEARWIELQIPGAETRVALFTPPGHDFKAAPCSNIVFGCDDVEKSYQEFCSRGITFTQAPKKESWGTSALFMDSEGNTFCLSNEQ